MRWVRRGNSREPQAVVGVQETTSMPLPFAVFNNCHSSTSEEKGENWEWDQSQWLTLQPTYLLSEPSGEIQKNWAQTACGLVNTGSWREGAVLTRAQRLRTAPSFFAGTSLPFFCLKFYFGNISNGFLKFSRWFYWAVEFEDGVMDPQSSILIIWSQAWLTWDLMAAIWTEEFSALNLQNLQ